MSGGKKRPRVATGRAELVDLARMPVAWRRSEGVGVVISAIKKVGEKAKGAPGSRLYRR